ncbi:MAG: hypothetical protein IBJ10_07170 [Phycisphaerales bacterium]|nr:hypothetical protein [Phycisphaerales bacterium]
MGRSRVQPAFTLAELVGVMVLVGVLAAAAIPALRSVERTREHALAREVQRRLCFARSWAASTGAPVGLSIDVGAGLLTLVRIEQEGEAPEELPNGAGGAGGAWRIAASFPSGAVLAVSHGDGSRGDGTIWFGPDGSPQVRAGDGAYIGGFTDDAAVTVSGPATITVRRLTGLVER